MAFSIDSQEKAGLPLWRAVDFDLEARSVFLCESFCWKEAGSKFGNSVYLYLTSCDGDLKPMYSMRNIQNDISFVVAFEGRRWQPPKKVDPVLSLYL